MADSATDLLAGMALDAPGSFSERDELRALGRVLKAHGARYSSHIRDESHAVHEAVAEAIDIGEQCGVHVQIAHMKLLGYG